MPTDAHILLLYIVALQVSYIFLQCNFDINYRQHMVIIL
jgi:hypothetical protein